ncbi:MAG: hypothetical protein Q8P41_29955 [Pseudomonadota bacterium]|nr:hypothetical protein [Pseudomonadota bacterium]
MTSKPEKFRLNVIGADEDVPRLLLAYGRGCGGEVAFAMRPRDNTALLVHQVKKAPAKVWRTDLGLAPSHAPELDADPAAAVAELRRMKAAPPPAGPATLKGKWAGLLVCDDGTPRVTLERKVASYGTLRLTSKSDGRWTATFDRAGKWFSQAKQESVERSGLAEAITAGMGLVVGLVSEACSFRDTRRRNTVDAEFAAQHPYTPPKEGKDPTGRYQPKATFRAVQTEKGWAVVNDVGATVATFGAREKGVATKHASALTRGKTPASAPTPSPSSPPSLESIPMPESPSCPTSVARIASATEKEAEALQELAQSLWGSTEAPELLGRAGKLIRHAQALVGSPLCSGKEQTAALEDVRRAAGAYQQASEAIGRGEKPDIVTTLRRIAERVSLAAARAAKSCAAGQQKLGTAPRTPEAPAPSVSMQPVWPPAAPPQAVPATKAPRTRKAKAPEVDPAKDQLLVNAFADAIKQAAQQMGGGA